MERAELIERLRDLLRERPEGLVAAYLYGSRARGSHRERSDVDLGRRWGGGRWAQAARPGKGEGLGVEGAA